MLSLRVERVEKFLLFTFLSFLSCFVCGGNDCGVLSYRVIVFVDHKQIETYLNWETYYKKLDCHANLSYLDVICLDAISDSRLRAVGRRCASKSVFLNSHDARNRLTEIWLTRMLIIRQYLVEGESVIISDLDAFWFLDPLPTLEKIVGSEVVASRAWWPWQLSKQWGASVCMGFAYFKAGPFGVDLFSHMLQASYQQYSKALRIQAIGGANSNAKRL